MPKWNEEFGQKISFIVGHSSTSSQKQSCDGLFGLRTNKQTNRERQIVKIFSPQLKATIFIFELLLLVLESVILAVDGDPEAGG